MIQGLEEMTVMRKVMQHSAHSTVVVVGTHSNHNWNSGHGSNSNSWATKDSGLCLVVAASPRRTTRGGGEPVVIQEPICWVAHTRAT